MRKTGETLCFGEKKKRAEREEGKKKLKKKRERRGKENSFDILGIMGVDQFHLKMGGRPEAMLG